MKSAVLFNKARQAFNFHNKIGNRSKETNNWYELRLRNLESFLCERHGKTVETLRLADVSTEDLREFIAYLQGKTDKYTAHINRKPLSGPLSPFTVRGYARAMAGFFNWCQKEGLLQKKPNENISLPKTPQQIKEIFTDQEMKALLKACEEHPEETLRVRDRAILLVLLDTGIRASELCDLTLDQIDQTWQRFKVRGKGMRERFVPISDVTRAALFKYVTFNRPADVEHSNRVFLSDRGNPLRRDVLALILRYLGDRASVPKCNPHKFRHTAATLFYKRSHGNLFLTQMFLGHSSPITTRIYAKTYTEDLQEAHLTASPVEGMGIK